MQDNTEKTKNSSRDIVPVIVLGTGLTALGVIRCLGRRGIPSWCISENLDNEAHSRWCRKASPRVGAVDDAASLSACLKSLPFERAVLMSCSDHWTLEITRLPDDLRARFPACVSSFDVNKRFVEKRGFEELLREAGVPHPRSAPVNSADDVSRLVGEWGGSVFLKPSNSQLFHRRFGEKAIRVNSVDEAVSRFTDAHAQGFDFILQEYIPGTSANHHFVDGFVNRDHDVVTFFARQRIRMHPSDFGNSSYVVSEELDKVEPATEALKNLFKTARYRGIFSAEFKQDERDGAFKIIEVNCRPWWYVEFAALCGVDVVEMAYRDALGLAVTPPVDYEVGVSLVYPYYDYQAIKNQPKETTPGMFEWLSLVSRSKQPIWSWDDPMPWAAGMGTLATRWLKSRLKNGWS